MPAPRRADALKTFAPPSASPLARAEASLLALLTATEMHEPDAPAAKAYRATMRTRGQEVAATGGADALDYLLTRIRAADPSRADVREAILDLAWTDLSGWRA
ncbi:hypothetical protein MKK55_11480 [Methylobacterium sp. J-059]|uniref:hypothetical protein n=1 Tax=Methylobacterium sp. J-059 TaxID=2836643 RepID=UPI001FB8EE38|nr:hypothetical protein [Methylobacterium sp. J-059]MCJ2039557.1 hypothetical protein [Methylobacterium sp. J-059]